MNSIVTFFTPADEMMPPELHGQPVMIQGFTWAGAGREAGERLVAPLAAFGPSALVATSRSAGSTGSPPSMPWSRRAPEPTGRTAISIGSTRGPSRRSSTLPAAAPHRSPGLDIHHSGGGPGALTYQFVVDQPAATQDGVVRVRFQDVGADYDPSIADVWAAPAVAGLDGAG